MILFILCFAAVFIGMCYSLGGANTNIPEEFNSFSELNNAKQANISRDYMLSNIL